jgi:hypothetical protein
MPPRQQRRYTKRERIAAIVAAEMTSNLGAAQALGIPETNVRRWRDDPELAKYGEKTREELAAGSMMLAHRALEAISARIGEFEPRDLVILLGVAVDKSQLLAGAATQRTETKDITARFTDHEMDMLADAIDDEIKRRETVPE